ncbi:MAG: SDR family NAD(P)-dependent oxidoreductase [Spirochaetota bacterium]
MPHTALVTGADHGLGLALTRRLLDRQWTVIAGRYRPDEHELEALSADHPSRLRPVALDVSDLDSVRRAIAEATKAHPVVDLVINNAATLGLRGLEATIETGLEYESIAETIDVNALGPLRVVESVLPNMERSALKRLCFVSSEAGSIARSHRKAWFGYTMSKTALNMGVSLLFNDLRPRGFTFRLYHPGWMQTYMKGELDRNADLTPDEAAQRALHYFLDEAVDEDRLVMRDNDLSEWPW